VILPGRPAAMTAPHAPVGGLSPSLVPVPTFGPEEESALSTCGGCCRKGCGFGNFVIGRFVASTGGSEARLSGEACEWRRTSREGHKGVSKGCVKELETGRWMCAAWVRKGIGNSPVFEREKVKIRDRLDRDLDAELGTAVSRQNCGRCGSVAQVFG